ACGVLALARGAAATPPMSSNPPGVAAAYHALPIYFEANQGQTDSRVAFVSRGNGYQLFLSPDEAVLTLRRAPANARLTQRAHAGPAGPVPPPAVLRMRLAGANPAPRLSGLEELPGTVNYLTGCDPQRWRRHIPLYARVKYEAVYPGIDLVYHGSQD